MDFLKAPPPRPPIGAIDSDIANVVKDAYRNIFIDNGSPDSYLSSDINNFLNDSFNGTFNLSSTPISNRTDTSGDEDVTEFIVMIVTSVLLGLMILMTVIGNVFVIAAIILERNLQNVANYLVASLAVADLLVACLVMPLGAVYEISQGWILGPELCDIWTSCDVLCCTASILHLVAIAMDRYWAVTNVDYIHSRTSGRVTIMIGLVWTVSIVVSLAPQFGWKDPEYMQRIEQQKCMVSQDVAYQVFATCSTFYVPLLVILVLYWKIYQTARKRIHRNRRPKQAVSANNNQVVPPKTKSRLRFRLASKFSSQGKSAVSSLGLVEGNSTNTVNTVEETEYSSNDKKGMEATTTFNKLDESQPMSSNQITTVSHQVSTSQISVCPQTNQLQQDNQGISTPVVIQNQISTPTIHHHQPNQLANNSQISTPIQQQHHQPSSSSTVNAHAQVKTRKETLEAKRERKAAKTLAIITGAFVVCWLPFFLMALLLPLCDSCHINDKIAAFFLWLGYFNSTLNPVIYTIFSPEFRQAFKRILFGTHRSGYYRGGKL